MNLVAKGPLSCKYIYTRLVCTSLFIYYECSRQAAVRQFLLCVQCSPYSLLKYLILVNTTRLLPAVVARLPLGFSPKPIDFPTISFKWPIYCSVHTFIEMSKQRFLDLTAVEVAEDFWSFVMGN